MFRSALKPAVRSTHVARKMAWLPSRSVSLLGKSPVPSSTTTLKMLSLPSTMTETSLRNALKGMVEVRKVEIEPGCAVHVLSEAEATYAVNALSKSKIDRITASECSISHTALPSLLLENVPSNVSLDALHASLRNQGLKPIALHAHGSAALRATFSSQEHEAALRAAKMLRNIKLEGAVPSVSVVGAPTGGGYVVTVHTASLSKESVAKMAEAVKAAFPSAQVANSPSNNKEILLRYAPHPKGGSEALNASVLEKVKGIPGVAGVRATAGSFPRPAVLLRRTDLFDEEDLKKLLRSQPGAGLLTANRRGRGAAATSMAVYFQTDAQAFEALATLRQHAGLKGPDGKTASGNKLSASYVALSVPTVSIKGLPAGTTEADVRALFTVLNPLAINLRSGEAIVTLNSPQEVELAIMSLNERTKEVNKKSVLLSVTDAPEAGSDIGVCVTLSDTAAKDTEALVIKALQAGKLAPLSSALKSNVSVFVAFETPAEAVGAHTSFAKKTATFDFGNGAESAKTLVTSKISVTPAYAVEIGGLGVETAVQSVASALTADNLVTPIRMDRSAILKFRRHKDIVPAFKAMKNKVLPGSEKPLTVVRFRAVPFGGSSEYDVEESEEGQSLARFDKFSLDAVLKDYMGADPGLRMQIAKSHFDRALFDAKSREDISFILSKNAPESTKLEAQRLLNMPSDTRASKQRLFELFVQREDMQRFTADFDEMRSVLGEADEDDPFDWSQFKLSNSDDMSLLLDELRQTKQEEKEARAMESGTHVVMKGDAVVDPKKAKKLQRKLAKEKRDREDMFGSADAADAEGADAEDGASGASDDSGAAADSNDPHKIFKVQDLSMENAPDLVDRDGQVWTGCILDTDVVQKTMPGNRVNTHRALVVIGNLRGAAGFGMGKGPAPAEALNAAFRDATRNLVHIDLFDNYGLAHDVYGKHNSCHAYIRATPKSRLMVGSPFACAILERFGIASASVKIVGRRDPYAQVRAVFNAISKHENIDEFAKDRGMRYATLRWVKDQGL